jgi:hypothetical protein
MFFFKFFGVAQRQVAFVAYIIAGFVIIPAPAEIAFITRIEAARCECGMVWR